MVFNKKSLREGIGRADKARIMRLGKGVEAIDKPIREVGKRVMPIDKKRNNIFDPL